MTTPLNTTAAIVAALTGFAFKANGLEEGWSVLESPNYEVKAFVSKRGNLRLGSSLSAASIVKTVEALEAELEENKLDMPLPVKDSALDSKPADDTIPTTTEPSASGAESESAMSKNSKKAATKSKVKADKKPRVKKVVSDEDVEKGLRAKYPHIIEGTIRAPKADGQWANKRTVEIYTVDLNGKKDGNKRRIATSDLFQVRHTEEVAKLARNKLRRKSTKKA